jgi:hypothetical protein
MQDLTKVGAVMQASFVHATQPAVTARDRRWEIRTTHTLLSGQTGAPSSGRSLIFFCAGVDWLTFQRLPDSRSSAQRKGTRSANLAIDLLSGQ